MTTTLSRTTSVTRLDQSPHAAFRPVGLTDVRWTGGFWGNRFDAFIRTALPLLWRQAADDDHGHVLANFRIAAGRQDGPVIGSDWQDAWGYKWIESAAVAWRFTGDPDLKAKMDELIELIAAAQAPDGYLATQSLKYGGQRYGHPGRHELYTMGHLLTAGALHHRMTGERTLLDVACRTADHVLAMLDTDRTRLAHFPLNPSIVMGGVELYRETGERRYLRLAEEIVNLRGTCNGPECQPGHSSAVTRGVGVNNQDRTPLRETTEVVGHCVFWSYLYGGAADIYMETGEIALRETLERLWNDLVTRKMYITGGVGAIHRGMHLLEEGKWDAEPVNEAVGQPYTLPHRTAYNETCGQVGTMYWAWRMLQITGDARYADAMEREMYNGILSGSGINADCWFYTNPLARRRDLPLWSRDRREREQIGRLDDICCPTNILRSVVQMHGYFFSTGADAALHVHHYGDCELRRDDWALDMRSGYPWGGDIGITIQAAPPGDATLALRIPAWSANTKVTINGTPIEEPIATSQYLTLRRSWQAGDEVRLTLDVSPRLVVANRRLEAVRNQAAVMCGPVVYCLESADVPDTVDIGDLLIDPATTFTPEPAPAPLASITALRCTLVHRPAGRDREALYSDFAPAPSQTVEARLIPYFAWANRGPTDMLVWLPLNW